MLSILVAWALGVAMHHWKQPPNCPIRPPTVVFAPLGTLEQAGNAQYETCQITINSELNWTEDPFEFCVVMTHEWGHLVLGPNYFAATNPTNPAHSPNPRNVMYYRAIGHFRPCEKNIPNI